MSEVFDFLSQARDLYIDANAATLQWILDRPRLGHGFLNTKQNSLTLRDYTEQDGMRGPDYLYGWIQGRGLEALVTHAAFFEERKPALAGELDRAGRTLYHALQALQQQDGHVYFCYDGSGKPVYPDSAQQPREQLRPGHIFTYSDAFVAKGLVVAASRYAPQAMPGHLAYLGSVIEAIEDGRFQIDERQPLSDREISAQPDDIGPRMILLGAAGMLTRLGHADRTGYANRFIAHAIERHLDRRTGLLANVPGGDACNVGHGIEFVGFALDHLAEKADSQTIETLEQILLRSFEAGFIGPGIALSISIATGAVTNNLCPWWSLPETIRSAALAHGRTGSQGSLAVWRKAHAAFFDSYWRKDAPLAYQTMTQDGPIDFVPATPDLDPGYHTGLSFL
ncbi:MAG: hypothetical protein KGI75_14675, partial [Rhizobiaceae bacterium]|nr:hypothetical protein [Rhizobiaceae bacterium]